jgi:hypothetical protein
VTPIRVAEERPRSELGWFRDQVRAALLAPRAFAARLAREHFGLAGLLVAVLAGASLSLAVDTLVLASRDSDVAAFAVRLGLDAGFVAVRMAVTAAVLALIARVGLLALRREAPSMDELVTAVAFSFAPFLLAFPAALPAALARPLGPVALALGAALAVRTVYGLGLNIRALLPRRDAAITLAVLVAAASVALADQSSRLRYVAYAYVPEIAPPLAAAPAAGSPYERFGIALAIPARWHDASRGIAGEIARFETDRDVLVVTRARGGAFLTPGDLADDIARDELRGMTEQRGGRDVVRISGMLVVDDRAVGLYEGRRIAYRQFTTVRGTQAYALVFRMIEPPDPQASLDEAARIAATWRLSGP